MSDDRGGGGDYGGGGNGGDYGGGGDTTPQPAAGTTKDAPLYGGWQPAVFMPYRRSIGGIIANVTIEENASDDLTITEHPVEQGAPIADHAFKRPATVTIRAGWSVARAKDLSAESGIYGLLLSWQASLRPFDLFTGKRRYSNMLMERLTVITDQKSEYALMADIVCRQVIIVATETTKVSTASGSSDNHTDPEKTGGSASKGDQPSTPVGDGGVLAPTDTRNLDPQFNADGSLPASDTRNLDSTVAAPTARTPDAVKVESVAVTNTTPSGLNAKGFTTSTPTEATAPIPPRPLNPPTRSVGLSWRRTLKYRPHPADRSRSGFRSSASSTR